jgi:hypothetical protein
MIILWKGGIVFAIPYAALEGLGELDFVAAADGIERNTQPVVELDIFGHPFAEVSEIIAIDRVVESPVSGRKLQDMPQKQPK